MSAPAEAGFTIDMTTTGTVAVPSHRYIKSDSAVSIRCKMLLDTAAITLPLVAGVNPERIKEFINPAAASTATIVFLK